MVLELGIRKPCPRQLINLMLIIIIFYTFVSMCIAFTTASQISQLYLEILPVPDVFGHKKPLDYIHVLDCPFLFDPIDSKALPCHINALTQTNIFICLFPLAL